MDLYIKRAYLFLSITLSFAVYGIDEDYSERMEGSEMTTIGEMTTYDDRYNEMQTNPFWENQFKNLEVTNKVRLGLNRKVEMLSDASLSVEIRVTSWDEQGDETIYTRTLGVEYLINGGSVIDDLSTFVFSGGHKVQVEILSLSTTTDIDYFYLQSEIEVNRHYFFDHTELVNSGVQIHPVQNQHIQMYWEYVEGAVEYELEYVHINDYKLELNGSIPATELAYDFYGNSIRIKTTKNHYSIPATFDRGYLIHRIRAIGRNGEDFTTPVNGVWNEQEIGSIADIHQNHQLYISSEFAPTKNWTYNTVLTEEGKRFEGVTYGDGLGRVRQNVTHNTVTNQMVVSPMYYDSHGRPTLSTLPVPEDSEEFTYRNNFNYYEQLDANGNLVAEVPLKGNEYDFINLSGDQCDPTYIPLSTNFGAGQYYSENNPNQEGENAHIPNANKFPYMRVEYMEDQTGRIKRVGAFGEEFQIGSGHETIFYYSTPSREELVRLFGSEVGHAYQYQKRLMRDANGQFYVTYYDLAGRVIASGMLGSSPDALDHLEGNVEVESFSQTIVPEDLYDLSTTPNTVVYSKPEVITSNDTYTFNFVMTPETYTEDCMSPNFCFDCVYEVNLKVIEAECSGEIIYDLTAPEVNGEVLNSICDASGDYSNTVSLELEVGTYQFERTITLVEEAKEYYWCVYLEETGCVEDYFSIFNSYYENENFSACETTSSLYGDNFDGPSECGVMLEMLLEDVKPGGQYALYDVDELTGEYTATEPLSVLNPNNQLTASGDYWRTPMVDYMDNENDIALIPLIDNGNNTFTPEVYDQSSVFYINNAPYIHPENLLHLKDFVDFFNPYWARSLVGYHPEYCYFEFCNQNSEFYDYKFDISQIIEHEEACAGGNYNPLAQSATDYFVDVIQNYIPLYSICTETGATDNFFLTGPGAVYLQDLIDDMVNFTTVEGNTVDLWSYSLAGSIEPSSLDNWNRFQRLLTTTFETCSKDKVWLTFRDLYLGLRYKYYKRAELDFVMENDCYNGCFNNPDFNPEDEIVDGQTFNSYVLPNNQLADVTNQPCSGSLYVEKIPKVFDYFGFLNQYPDLNNSTDMQQEVFLLQNSSCQLSCETNAEDWIASLKGCELSPTSLEGLKQDLIDFCKYGCEQGYQNSVSTLPPGETSTNGYNSFEAILASYLGPDYISEGCNVYLLPNLPPSYENAVSFGDEVSLGGNILDDCGCDILFDLSQEYTTLEASNTLPEGVSNIEEYYYFVSGIWIEDIDELLCKCNEYYYLNSDDPVEWTGEGIFGLLNESIIVPAALACGETNQDCIDCVEMLAIQTEIDDYFLGQSIENSNNYNIILRNYANNKLGFSLRDQDYIDFLKECNAGTPEAADCELSNLALAFKDMLNIIVKRGQLHTSSSLPIDLAMENIVYANSALSTAFSGSNFWSCVEGSCGTTMELNFGLSTADACAVSLSLPLNADFEFKDIINVISINLLSAECGTDQTFELFVEYFSCGERNTGVLTGATSCLELAKCFCGEQTLLCNDASADFYMQEGDCYSSALSVIVEHTDDTYTAMLGEQKALFFENYDAQCKLAFNNSSWKYTGGLRSYQFTLFYYDQAGNLVKTVAPEGINFVTNPTDYTAADGLLNNATLVSSPTETPVDPGHTFQTVYEYNSYNQLASTTNPDQEGNTVFWYDRAGRIVASQNPVQEEKGQYSYTLYDIHGRPEEVGQVGILKFGNPPLTENIVKANDIDQSFRAWVAAADRTEITHSYYDDHKFAIQTYVNGLFEGGVQQNLRLRVASVVYFKRLTNGQSDIDDMTNYESATHYSYDPHGNVIETVQDVPLMAPVEQQHKSTQYEFELISGNMTKVNYQKGQTDEFIHQYCYDELNRLTEVYTSTDNIYKSRDAAYQYYDYGPLSRTEIGEYNIQGNDYTYTINGWLKGMNSNSLTMNNDMGKDGTTGFYTTNENIHKNYAKDVIGYSLGYFEGDYSAIGGNSFEASYSGTQFGNGSSNLYNGNIRHMVTAIQGLDIQGYAYKYDQLQRLKEMKVYRDPNLPTNHNWSTSAPTDDYLTQISYDKNGNILSLDRNGFGQELAMDRFVYAYHTINNEQSNRLNYVTDNGQDYLDIDGNPVYEDIKTGQLTNNYQYNKIGELTKDEQEGMTLDWRVGDHKLSKIYRGTNTTTPQLEFIYSPFGIRVAKIKRTDLEGNVLPLDEQTVTYYGYDANGQLMAVYESQLFEASAKTFLEERYIYGMQRHGVIREQIMLYDNGAVTSPASDVVENTLGKKRYELTNHLNNVLATISDRKIYNSTDSHYEAVVTMYADYYAGGMLMPGRHGGQLGRYLFNGMEHDGELSGDGNSYTTEYRQYDPRLMRWKSRDPLEASFPWQSPYVAFDNNPIYYKDPKGLAAEGGGNSAPVDPDPVDGQTRVENGQHQIFFNGDWAYDPSGGEGIEKTAKPTLWQKAKGLVRKINRAVNFTRKVGTLAMNESISGGVDFLVKLDRILMFRDEFDRSKRPTESNQGYGGTNYVSKDGKGHGDKALQGGIFTDQQEMGTLPGSIAASPPKPFNFFKPNKQLTRLEDIYKLVDNVQTARAIVNQAIDTGKDLVNTGQGDSPVIGNVDESDVKHDSIDIKIYSYGRENTIEHRRQESQSFERGAPPTNENSRYLKRTKN